jgi:membrane associated rhomboid family serine protease
MEAGMFNPNHNAPPINAIPPVITLLVGLIAVIEIAFQLGASGMVGGRDAIAWRRDAVIAYGFADPLFDHMVQNRVLVLDGLKRFVTYPFIHVSAMHAVFAGVILLAIGKFVAERFNVWVVVLIFFASAIFGASIYGLIIDTRVALVGAYPAVYGLLGAFTWSLFVGYGAKGENPLQAFQLIGLLLGLQLIFGIIGGGGSEWIADVAGFIAGFGISFAMAPGGRARLAELLRKSRQR